MVKMTFVTYKVREGGRGEGGRISDRIIIKVTYHDL